jgi:hypothetical protein
MTQAIFAAARTLTISEPRALELALKSAYLPSLPEPSDDHIEAVVSQGIPRDEAQTLVEYAASLIM